MAVGLDSDATLVIPLPSYASALAANNSANGIYMKGASSLNSTGLAVRHRLVGTSKYLQRAPGHEVLNFTLELAIQNEQILMDRVNGIYTTEHRRRFVTSYEVQQLHEPSAADILAVQQELATYGLHTRAVVGRMMSMTADASSINIFFQTVMAHWLGLDGQTFTAALYDARVPSHLGISNVLHLDTVKKRIPMNPTH